MNLDWATAWASDFHADTLDRALEQRYAADVIFEDVTLGKRAQGVGELRTFFGTLLGADAGEHRFTATGYQGDESGGVIEWIWDATHARDLMGLPATGKRTSVRGVSVVRFEGGKITAQRDYWDAMTVFQQLKR